MKNLILFLTIFGSLVLLSKCTKSHAAQNTQNIQAIHCDQVSCLVDETYFEMISIELNEQAEKRGEYELDASEVCSYEFNGELNDEEMCEFSKRGVK